MKIHLSNLPIWLGIPVPPPVTKIYDRRGVSFKEEFGVSFREGRLQHNTLIDTPLMGLSFQRHENLANKNSVIITFILFLALFTAETLRFNIRFVTSPLTKEAQSCSNSHPIVIFENLLSFLCNLWVMVCSMENLWVISTKKMEPTYVCTKNNVLLMIFHMIATHDFQFISKSVIMISTHVAYVSIWWRLNCAGSRMHW